MTTKHKFQPITKPRNQCVECGCPENHSIHHGLPLSEPSEGRTPPTDEPSCEHGTALDVHCCNCHSGFFPGDGIDHECPDPATCDHEAFRGDAQRGYSCCQCHAKVDGYGNTIPAPLPSPAEAEPRMATKEELSGLRWIASTSEVRDALESVGLQRNVLHAALNAVAFLEAEREQLSRLLGLGSQGQIDMIIALEAALSTLRGQIETMRDWITGAEERGLGVSTASLSAKFNATFPAEKGRS